MNFKNLLANEDAVSPVIGVILMVAITVILAAVIGTFVLGLGDQVQQTAPNAQISGDQGTEAFEANDPNNGETPIENISMTLSHEGGDGLNSQNIDVTVDGEQAWGVEVRDGDSDTPSALWDTGDIRSGSSITIIAAVDPHEDETGDIATDGEYTYDDTEPGDGLQITGGGLEEDYLNVGLQSGQTVHVTWTAEDGDRSTTLFTRDIN